MRVDSGAEKALTSLQLKFPAFSFGVPRFPHRPKTTEHHTALFAFSARFNFIDECLGENMAAYSHTISSRRLSASGNSM
jgi:hypothetical protein